jgi:phasin family protein
MYDKMFEQAQSAIKPFSELLTANAKLLEDATQKQTAYIQDFVSDTMAFAKELSSQKDYSGIYQTQKAFMENMQEKWIAASTSAYETFTTNQEKLGELFKQSSTV